MAKTFTPEQKEEYKKLKRDEAKQKLDDAIAEIKTEAGWKHWLRTRSSFHKYSLSNTILLAIQTRDWDPAASQVAGAKKWQKDFDRKIKKGEKALRIFAPIMVNKRDKNGNEIIGLNGKPEKIPAFYKLVPVFDVSQTEGPALPDTPPCVPIEGDDHLNLLASIHEYASKHGITIEFDDDISINATVRQAVRQIAERQSSLFTVDKDAALLTTAEREIIKEAITYIVLTGLNFDTSQESVPHIAAWQEEDDMDVLRTFAKYIDKEACEIEKLLKVR